MNFHELNLIDPVVKALQQEGYTEPTPIQRGAIPPALNGRDVLGCAQTGTGKTCAFAAPILQRLHQRSSASGGIRALILTPTRELAIQIGDSFRAYGRNLPLRHTVVFGGVGQQPQVNAIRRGIDILIATPGRLLDLHGQGLLDLSHIEIFVLDEADRMLDMGFIHDVKRVLKLLPEKKQTLFFSATMPPEVMSLVNGLLHDYVRVEVNPVSSPVEVIRQSLYYVDKANKTKLLSHLIREMKIPAALVFSRTKHGANRIAQDLNKAGITAAAIHGNKSQTARVQALNDFKAGRVQVLVATDIAARGIDIEELGCVFNYNLPDVPETYVHRIGRTGRAGRDGVAISFCQFDEKDELKGIEKLLGRPIPVVENHPFPMENFDLPQKDKHGRPVNAEDAEARAAAKERRRQRDAENKARAEARKQAEAMAAKPASAPAEQQPAPAAKKRRRKKNGGSDTAQADTVQTSPSGTASVEEKAAAVRHERTSARGVRQGSLADTMPTQPTVASADFVKPNPMDSDVIMDATARLLSSGMSAPSTPKRGAESKTRPDLKKTASEQEPARPAQQKRRRSAKRKAGNPSPAQPTVREPAPRQSASGQEKPSVSSGKSGRRRNDRPRGQAVSHSLDRQKDSTQQKSLMKPYYISHDD